MTTEEVQVRKLVKRIERMSIDFWMFAEVRGINNREWTLYFERMMIAGRKLKAINPEFKPRSKRYPVEFRELFLGSKNEVN